MLYLAPVENQSTNDMKTRIDDKGRPITDELTTLMHWELIGEEIPKFDLFVMAVYGAMRGGLSKQEALAKYNLTEEEYDANIDRVLNS